MACIFFTPLFTVVYFVEQLILDNLCAKQGDLSIPWPKTAVLIERVQIKSEL